MGRYTTRVQFDDDDDGIYHGSFFWSLCLGPLSQVPDGLGMFISSGLDTETHWVLVVLIIPSPRGLIRSK